MTWTAESLDDGRVTIDIRTPSASWIDDRLLAGLTFHVANPSRTTLTVDGQRELPIRQNPKDSSGRASISVPWPRLEFPGI